MSRALAHAGVTGMAQFDDPVAAELLSPQYRSILRAISLLPLPLRRVLSRATLGGLDLVRCVLPPLTPCGCGLSSKVSGKLSS